MALPASRERGAIVIPTLIAALLGAVLAVGGSVVLVRSQANPSVAPVNKPLVTYDQR
jgi:hypothetical protein